MSEINQQALTRLSEVIATFIPEETPGVSHSLFVTPKKISPTGLGGYIGPHKEPEGDITGRTVDAEATLIFSAATGAQATFEQVISAVSSTFASADRAELAPLGLHRLFLSGIENQDDAGNNLLQRKLNFAVLFEYLHVPSEGEGIIEEIPITIELEEEES